MARTTDTATNALLEQDDAVDALTDRQICDVYARGQFMHAIIKAHGSAYMRSEECDEVEQMLSQYAPEGLKRTAIHALGRDHPVAQSLGWENGPGNVETLFDRLTNDDLSREECIEKAREHIKSACRGTGMPRINVMRERVKYHRDNPDDL